MSFFILTLHLFSSSLENECLVTLRTSGTEPKIKYYTEFKGTDGNVPAAQKILDTLVVEIIETLLEPKANGLI